MARHDPRKDSSMAPPTHFLQDIFRQPAELQRTIEYLTGPAQGALQQAQDLVRRARHVFVTGIGASWHAALSAGSLFYLGGLPVYLQEAAELLHFTKLPPGAVIVAISRSGRSVEIVQLLAKAQASGATMIGITNSQDSPLAREAAIPIVVPAMLDYGISVNTYSTLAVAVGALAGSATTGFDSVASSLSRAVGEMQGCLGPWQQQLADSQWPTPGVPCYFLARGSSVGSCHEARLLWEEGAKSPATAMGTGDFRHGPQEIVTAGLRVCMWIDASRMRSQDLAVADDLRELGASVMLIGQKLPENSRHLVFQLPEVPLDWQFVIDIIPAQLGAEHLARLAGVDCDAFRVCSYIVEDEHGLLHRKADGVEDGG